MGAFAVDVMTRGLLSFSLPPDSFDKPPLSAATGVIEPILDEIVSSIGGIQHLAEAVKNRDVRGVIAAFVEIASEKQDIENLLADLLKKYATAKQVRGALDKLGTFFEILDLPEKIRLSTELTARTFDAPPSSSARIDAIAKTQVPSLTLVSPEVITTRPLPQTQTLTLTGSGFTSETTLVFKIGTATYASRPERLRFISPSKLEYDIAVGGATGTWTVSLAQGTGSSAFQVVGGSSGLYTITPSSGSHGSIIRNRSRVIE